MDRIYAVYATHVDNIYLLGYAIGEMEDINAYYDDQKAYGLKIKAVKPVAIPKGFAVKRKALLQQKAALQAQLDKLNKELKIET